MPNDRPPGPIIIPPRKLTYGEVITRQQMTENFWLQEIMRHFPQNFKLDTNTMIYTYLGDGKG